MVAPGYGHVSPFWHYSSRGLIFGRFGTEANWSSGCMGLSRFTVIYFSSGLTGNLLSLVANKGLAISGGASGAIFGIYGALLVFLWRERHNLHPQDFRWFFWGAAGFAIVSLFLGFLITGIDNAAHIGGFLAGTLGGVIFTPAAESRGRCLLSQPYGLQEVLLQLQLLF